ncbi:Oidioi.mRNA.OKI2018_I69.PAR.g9513.t1.cds [Oikopleura dioica]|uniref:Oidioi.mRNA.OKI2018_I69.PAR.g9513.t1.cds n=1 Tax=Oikopleura dioica TaxID=34765 RepID=A0ABN7RTN7_OIKDI|nr:Oidioi.mRNA.OKI2018_I69.PAR.g9513.t1.cds [Oikopleura dioica]
MFHTRNETGRVRASSIDSEGRSRPSTPEGSILYDLLTTGRSKASGNSSASQAAFKNTLDESINYLIRKCTFLKIPSPNNFNSSAVTGSASFLSNALSLV